MDGPGHTAIFFRIDSLIRSLAAPSLRTNCFTSNCAWWEIICPGEDAGGEQSLFRREEEEEEEGEEEGGPHRWSICWGSLRPSSL